MVRPFVRCVIGSSVVALAAVVSPCASAAVASASSPPVSSWRVASDDRWTQGQVNVDAPPDVVWSRLEHVESWPQLLSDISNFRVVDRQGSQWKIELETHTLDHGMLPYTVELQGGRQVRLWAKGPGVTIVAFTLVRDGPTPRTSNVVYSLYIDLSGLTKLLIGDATLRNKQRHMVDVTLGDIWRAYAPH
jgi:uncharacterized membrane protein